MHGNIIDVGAQALLDAEPVAPGFGGLTEMLLLVGDEVFGACDHSGLLDALHRLGHGNARENRIWTEALPVSTASWDAPKRTNDWAQLHVDAFVAELATHHVAALAPEASIPGRRDGTTGGEGRDVVG